MEVHTVNKIRQRKTDKHVYAECVYLANKYIATDKYGLGFAECEMRSIK